MQQRIYVPITLFVLFIAGCTKDFNIKPTGAQPRYVIEGKISNMQGPYYVRITKAKDAFTPGMFSGLDDAEAIQGALVIITDDNLDLTDTLKPITVSDPGYDPSFMGERGYYGTTKLTGMSGHTYHLQVRYGAETFQASASMPPTVPVIDSVVLKKDLAANPDGLLGDAAFAYFSEPQDEKNYYLLQLNAAFDSAYDHVRWVYGVTTVFPYYVFNDNTLPPYVKGMEALIIYADGQGHGRFEPNWINPYDPVQVRLSAITRETYEYLNALGKQFLDDGNVYKPAPASAAGNISGGALGLFWAANVSGKVVLR